MEYKHDNPSSRRDELRTRVAELEQALALTRNDLMIVARQLDESARDAIALEQERYELCLTLQRIRDNRDRDSTCQPGCDCSWCLADNVLLRRLPE